MLQIWVTEFAYGKTSIWQLFAQHPCLKKITMNKKCCFPSHSPNFQETKWFFTKSILAKQAILSEFYFLKPFRFRKSAQQQKKPWIYSSFALIQTQNLMFSVKRKCNENTTLPTEQASNCVEGTPHRPTTYPALLKWETGSINTWLS